MKIMRAKVDGFGKYIERTFSFGDGLNVIYGKNEAGKSTLQQFLLAMLYGMKKPGRKRTVYLEDEAKYRPWQWATYGGVLMIEVDGVPYRIERSLRRDDDWVRLFRQDTGEEVTGRFSLDSRKELKFAQKLWQADRELFVNTLCIGPVQERERAAWLGGVIRSGEVVHPLEGDSDAAATPEQQKMRLALEALEKRLDAIGSERAATKPYGQALKSVEDLNRALNEAREREQTQKQARMEAERSTGDWQEAVQAAESLREELMPALASWAAYNMAKKKELLGQLNLVDQALAENKRALPVDLEEAEFRQLQSDFQRFVTVKRESESYQKRLDVLEAEGREAALFANQYKTMEESHLQEVEQTAYELEHIEQQAEAKPPEIDPEEIASLVAQHRSQKRKMWFSFGAAVLVAPFGLSQWWALLIVLVLLVYGVYGYFSAQKLADSAADLQETEEQQIAEAEAARLHQEELEARLLELLSAFEVDTPRQYRQKWTQLLKAREQVAQSQKQTQWLLGEVNRTKGERDILARRLIRLTGKEEAQAASLDPEQLRIAIERMEQGFQEAHELKEQMHAWEKERAELLHQIQSLSKELERWQELANELGISEFETWLTSEEMAEAGSFQKQVPPEQLAEELERLYQALRQAERELLEKKASFTEATTRYRTMSEGQTSAADLLLEKQRAEEVLQQLEAEREALLLAKEVWTEVTEDLYQSIAPQFATALSEVTAHVTQGRYKDVFLDRGQSITALSPDSGKTVDLTSLSEGTIDQITFALGLAMSGWMIPGGNKLPLLLDEPFRRYDDERLSAVLEVLLKEAERRQIFLFTCREQEVKRILELGGERVQVVELAQDESHRLNLV